MGPTNTAVSQHEVCMYGGSYGYMGPTNTALSVSMRCVCVWGEAMAVWDLPTQQSVIMRCVCVWSCYRDLLLAVKGYTINYEMHNL